MKLVCPGCGATASLETWNNDAACRETIKAVAALPGDLSTATLHYLSLFRPTKRALTWKKALKLVQEIQHMSGLSHVQVQGQVARPCSPRIWVQAMEDMVSRSSQLSRPMKNHNYLKQVAYDLANKEDGQHEAETHRRAVSGEQPLTREDEKVEPLSQEEIDALPEFVRESYLKRMQNAK